MTTTIYTAIDLFCGCGGATEGLSQAGFSVISAIDNNALAIKAHQMNHPKCQMLSGDIRQLDPKLISDHLNGKELTLLTGCPPCQGFSSVRRLNRNRSVRDPRNSLIAEYLRFVRALRPVTIMLENVAGLENYSLFPKFILDLEQCGYSIDYEVVNIKNYGIPQSRKRLILLGSRLGPIKIAAPTGKCHTVRDAIANLPDVNETTDELHKMVAKHGERIAEMISMIPHNGGSRKELPPEYILACHKKENVGFNDIYGRLRWDTVSTTITGGCLNPSKGRFLHPEANRCITPREAALLQSFPMTYKFPTDIPKVALGLMIGNALPPKFAEIQARQIHAHLKAHGR